MARHANVLLHKPDDLSPILRVHIKRQTEREVHICDPSTLKVRWEAETGESVGRSQASQLGYAAQ